MNLEKFNRHWEEGFSYFFEEKRFFFNKLKKHLEYRQIIALTGLRRTGKTTLLKQIINLLIEQKNSRKNILYFSFDEEKPPIDELLKNYSEITSVNIGKDKLFVFLDEVQKLENWQDQIKTYYDNYENIKFFVSGSSSLFIKKKSDESLAGRIFVLDLPVLSFEEFLHFKKKQTLLKNPKMHANKLQFEFIEYLKKNFIETINTSEDYTKEYLKGIISKVVYEDIPQIFPVENPEKLYALLKAIYSSPGMIINYESIGKDLNMNSRTTEQYLSYLIKSKLVKKIYNYSSNFLTSEKKSKKVYVTAPSMCFLNDEFSLSKIVENIICVQGDYSFFWRTSQKEEIDFIAKINKKAFPIEVKYTTKDRNKEIKTLHKFMKKNKINKSIVITKDTEKRKTINNKKIEWIPARKWLLNKKS
jgi:uncharacterized protein